MFGSDNQAPAHPNVLEAILAANDGRAASYGSDVWNVAAHRAICEVFETDDLDLYLVGTGGAANGLGLGLICPAWGAIACHNHAHILTDEGSGPEMFTQGARLVSAGSGPLLLPQDLKELAQRFPRTHVHSPQIRAVSVTNLSENGLAYSPQVLGALAEVCKEQGWGLHMDGARFANAVAHLGTSPANLSWRSGIDVLSFGLTKNGALNAEALIVFGRSRDGSAAYMRKRAGQLFSKQRYLAAQFVAMLEGDLWLNLARHANAMAADLGHVFAKSGIAPLHPVEGNEVFVRLSDGHTQALTAAGVTFYPWQAMGPHAHRFVASWQSTPTDVETVARALAAAI